MAEIDGYPATFHVRNFLDCVKSRGLPRANAEAACYSHIACHAANIAMFLNRKLNYDPKKNVFLGDEEANRLRSEALREPWRRNGTVRQFIVVQQTILTDSVACPRLSWA